jgi:hypothetical protein
MAPVLVPLEESLRLLDTYAATPAQRAAAVAFLRSEADAVESKRKSKCFLILGAAEAVGKAGEGRVVFREPTQKHHVVIEPDGSKTKGLAQPGGFAVRRRRGRRGRRCGAGTSRRWRWPAGPGLCAGSRAAREQ